MFNKEVHNMKVNYKEIVYNLTLFLESIGVSSDVTAINFIVKYMISCGFFTNNEILTSSMLPKDVVDMELHYLKLCNTGMMLPYGFVSCRHIANFLWTIYSFLGYQNSQLFVYEPIVKSYVNFGDNDISDIQVQKNIDSILGKLDLFSLSDFQIQKIIDGIEYEISYQKAAPAEIGCGNHTINIVLDKQNKLHLLDSTADRVATKTSQFDILYMHIDEVRHVWEFVIPYFNNNYRYARWKFKNAISLLERYDTVPVDEEFEKMREIEKECERLMSEFRKFKQDNSRYYNSISGSVMKLVRSLDK